MAISNGFQYNQINGATAATDGFEWVDLETVTPSVAAINLSPGDFALKHQLLPLRLDGTTLVVAVGTPESLGAVDDLSVLLQMPTRAVLASPNLVREKVEEIFLERILAGLSRPD